MRKAAPSPTARMRRRWVRHARAVVAGALCLTLAGGCLPIGIRGSNLPSFAAAGTAPALAREAPLP